MDATNNDAGKSPSNKRAEDKPLARLLRAFIKTKSGLMDKIKAERDFGEVWCTVKSEIKLEPGMTIQKWLLHNKLPFSYVYANGCGRLFKASGQFEPAHNWYQQSGIELGWQTKKNTGWEYAMEVIALHKRSMDGLSPTDSTVKKKTEPGKTVSELKKLLADRETEVSVLFQALDRLNELYRKTPQGADYVDQTLHVVRIARHQHAEIREVVTEFSEDHAVDSMPLAEAA